MAYCLNPNCNHPENPQNAGVCQNCGKPLTELLRGRYRVLKPLGRGGMGRTYLAVDEDKLRSFCVIKQFSPQIQTTGERRDKSVQKSTDLFYQEAMRLHELGEHPQIPTLLAYFEHQEQLYLVQQLIRGPTLWQELRHQGAFSEKQIWDILEQLLPVLGYIHGYKVVHRDIKPTNIIRRKQDKALVLIDFGIAKQLTATGMARVGTKIGTEGYAPIEQIRSGRAYPASDLYSLGVTCIHLLTGLSPDELFDPLTGNWLWRETLKEQEIVISDRLGQILDKLLKDIVSDRYQSAQAVIADMNPVPSPPNVIVPEGYLISPPAVQDWHCVHTLHHHSGKIQDLAIHPQGNLLASSSEDKTLCLWRMSGQKLEKVSLLSTLTGHEASVGAVAIHPEGELLVSGSHDKRILFWRLPESIDKQIVHTQPILVLNDHRDWVNTLVFSPSGSLLASGSNDKTVRVRQLAVTPDGEWEQLLLLTLTSHTDAVNALAFSADGRWLASGGEDRVVKVWNVETGTLHLNLPRHAQRINALAFSPRNRILASGSDDGTIRIWDSLKGHQIRTLTEHGDSIFGLVFSPDGQVLLSSSRDRTIKIWDLENWKSISTLDDHSWWVRAIALSQDGLTLVTGSGDATIKIWRWM
ncbi:MULTISPECIES: serine/threonine-protein kinase [unclassified Roseofilum]|uniref:serine/threonine-protein kinase n=1 Tax=unclassified Roseofilum TaxID=2620099 RepID=UPI001B04EDC9|nr:MULTISPECIES: serine/threonine-protein kinase [unclassified Roseofilum]MBP0007590.1 protein kinase [Roseofilum sp. Belize Diploria]MBP0011502.1 protein kinase [Roseofilum sp. SID3]MBP0022405.1 protein kinase [Roseofilum sp. SID2]MBP0033637.1 protein kinase [Roseofilum sp. Belize BBD 4]MBP0036921.1 protein kinase [Roseofilum sp. SID1]